MSADDAAKYQKQSDECREQAARAMSEVVEQNWLQLADEWLKLAQAAADRQW